MARKGHTAQDVAIVLNAGLQLSRLEVQEMIDRSTDPPRAEPSSTSRDPRDSREELPGEGRLNPSGAEMAEMRQLSVTAQHKKRHDETKAKAKLKEKEQLVDEKARKLRSSAAAREPGLSIGAHAKHWAEQETGEIEQGAYFGGGRAKRMGIGNHPAT